jgi:glycosyltransferase involved in cell wall biosynthesis
MNVLRVINSLDIGGAERGVSDILPVHIENGLDIELLLLDEKLTDFKSKLIHKGVKIYGLGENIFIYNPRLILRIIPFLKKYSIVHVSLFPAFYLVAFASIFVKKGPKLIFTEHNTTNRRRNNFVFKIIDLFAYSRYDHVVNISNGSGVSFVNYTSNKISSSIIYNGVNFDSLLNYSSNDVALLEVIKDKKVILQVSSFRDDKDQETLIKAIPLLGDNYILLLAGVGKNLGKCKLLSQKLDLENKVVFLGLQNNIGSIISLSNVCVLSSHVEGFGRSAVECMFMKKPTIGSNVAGLNEVILNENLLFNVGDHIRLSNIIKDLCEDEDYYNKTVDECFAKAKMFDYKYMIESYEELYLNII